ncbi:MAG: hypothetical protein AB7G12_02480 [Thermoanaerobaculia bacterium]
MATDAWVAARSTERLWNHEAALFTGHDESRWLGWLDAPEREMARLDLYAELPRRASREGITDVVLLGMGGSSLAAEVFRLAWGERPGAQRLHVLDSTHPEQVRRTLDAVDPRRTWVLVASKSGSTLEPNLLLAIFLERFGGLLGEAAPGHFLAITDPGSALDRRAREGGFLALVPGEPSIGGRFSALSPFGLTPAAFLGVDLSRFLGHAAAMAGRCRAAEALDNPGVELGLALAAAAGRGRDKLTLILAPPIAALGVWLEQLIAESTGKQGRMILPVEGEAPLAPTTYGGDRLFVGVRLAGELAGGDEDRIDALVAAGQPVLELDCAAVEELGAEMFRWEIATAVAGARLGIHPFDQPDVEAAKVAARRRTVAIEEQGSLPEESPFVSGTALELYADADQQRALPGGAGPDAIADCLRAHFDRAGAGDYLALQAFLDMNEENAAALEALRTFAGRSGVATTVGFGPRFLHSTGQAHKGGPASGVFLQITEQPLEDLAVPGQSLTFGQVVAAQAGGDLEVLATRGRRHLRLHFPGGAAAGWQALRAHLAFGG